jgi:ABC-type methionine transport system ATPase subunit
MPTDPDIRHVELHFPRTQVKEPVLYHLVKDYGLKPNVLVARVEAADGGHLRLEITGSDDQWSRASAWLRGLGISVTSTDTL